MLKEFLIVFYNQDKVSNESVRLIKHLAQPELLASAKQNQRALMFLPKVILSL